MIRGADRPFLAHVQELSNELRGGLLTLFILFLPIWFVVDRYLPGTLQWLLPEKISALHYFSPMEVLIVELKAAFFLSLTLGLPVILYRLWRFIRPALYPHERRRVKIFVVSSYFLWLLGCAFAWGLILPLVMRFSAQYATATLVPTIGFGAFIGLAFDLGIAFGVMFQMPLAVILLCRIGVVNPDWLRRKRPLVIVGILTVAAILTPPDVASQMLLAIPTFLLFELGLFFCPSPRQPSPQEADPDLPDPDPEPELADSPDPTTENSLAYYQRESRRKTRRPLRSNHRR